MKDLQQSADPSIFTNTPLSLNISDSTDLKLILNHLDAVHAKQSNLFDLVNKQSKKLDIFTNKLTQLLSELSEL
ncbi:Hypothetical protein CINCED_3A018350 [Cinara cedri]|uniref:Uncharacterized protein n=1 Tax=Cinara cedri TaxID=506608 RepID=A0A5E4NJJ8_9HEMI|nr:Hypothetical protein CINCED_3A018350 [Cinara cedri]